MLVRFLRGTLLNSFERGLTLDATRRPRIANPSRFSHAGLLSSAIAGGTIGLIFYIHSTQTPTEQSGGRISFIVPALIAASVLALTGSLVASFPVKVMTLAPASAVFFTCGYLLVFSVGALLFAAGALAACSATEASGHGGERLRRAGLLTAGLVLIITLIGFRLTD